jgi:hypothetical protein
LQKQIEGVQKQQEGFPKTKSATNQLAADFMYPIMDFSSSVAEMALLAKLQQALPKGVKLSSAVLDEIRSLHEFSLKSTTRSATDFVPHRRLIWVFDSDAKGKSGWYLLSLSASLMLINRQKLMLITLLFSFNRREREHTGYLQSFGSGCLAQLAWTSLAQLL